MAKASLLMGHFSNCPTIPLIMLFHAWNDLTCISPATINSNPLDLKVDENSMETCAPSLFMDLENHISLTKTKASYQSNHPFFHFTHSFGCVNC